MKQANPAAAADCCWPGCVWRLLLLRCGCDAPAAGGWRLPQHRSRPQALRQCVLCCWHFGGGAAQCMVTRGGGAPWSSIP